MTEVVVIWVLLIVSPTDHLPVIIRRCGRVTQLSSDKRPIPIRVLQRGMNHLCLRSLILLQLLLCHFCWNIIICFFSVAFLLVQFGVFFICQCMLRASLLYTHSYTCRLLSCCCYQWLQFKYFLGYKFLHRFSHNELIFIRVLVPFFISVDYWIASDSDLHYDLDWLY